jgi:hypothetical protein
VLGGLTLIPWVMYVFESGSERVPPALWSEVLQFKFWGFWMMEPMGFYIGHSLGRTAFSDFLRYPLMGDTPTYGMALVHFGALVAGLFAVGVGLSSFWNQRHQLRSLVIGRSSESAMTQNAAFWGFGSLLSFTRATVYRHYLLVAFPLPYVWISRMALSLVKPGRRILLLLWVLELMISAQFLHYIHVNVGAPEGDYGVKFSAQGR